MFTSAEYRSVEPECYELDHVDRVLNAIKKNFDSYFNRFIETEDGNGVSLDDFEKLKQHFGLKSSTSNKKTGDLSAKYKRIINEVIDEFESDRKKYIDIFNIQDLEELEDDADFFKSEILRNKCPIIHHTLMNKTAKELDKYRREFNVADPDDLLAVVTNLCTFLLEYEDEYDSETYDDSIITFKDLRMGELDTDEYTAYGVIGGGIKTMMLYKVNPSVFSSRSRNALWALWYLTDKQNFGCATDSEFLMIDTKKYTTQQNYFYPYELFSYYAFEIYKLLKEKAEALDVYLDTDYRYVFVDAFFDYVAWEHDDEIALLKTQIRNDGGMGYA